ncbi:MAG: class I SAM-dependent methyltransferase [Bryobacterales bacterium]|nr:class I SAM-dependent methyltransferase [Bryobacterales bacterium]
MGLVALLFFVVMRSGFCAGPMSDREIEAYLETMEAPSRRYNNVERAEGAYLRDLVRRLRAKRVLEIGTSTGYSGIWMAMGLRQTGGRLITIEYNRERYASAAANFTAAGLTEFVDARHADAVQEVPGIEGPLDLVFLDAVPGDNLLYYGIVLPKMRRGGAIVAHNVRSHPADMVQFLKVIGSDPAVKTEIVTPGRQGFSVSWVK